MPVWDSAAASTQNFLVRQCAVFCRILLTKLICSILQNFLTILYTTFYRISRQDYIQHSIEFLDKIISLGNSWQDYIFKLLCYKEILGKIIYSSIVLYKTSWQGYIFKVLCYIEILGKIYIFEVLYRNSCFSFVQKSWSRLFTVLYRSFGQDNSQC